MAAACAGSGTETEVDTANNDGAGAGGLVRSPGSGSGTSAPPGCAAEATDFVYVLSSDDVLYRFAPDKKVFTAIGPLGCSTALRPNSMAVDRNAVAWVNYFDDRSGVGALYRVSTRDGSCLGQVATLTGDWFQVGMGYSGSGPDAASETLYVASTHAGVLGSVDASGIVTPIGAFTGALAGRSAELTGTGDGRLFGFFTTSPVEVAEVDETSAATAAPRALPAVETPMDWAFSFWGGRFYLYTWQTGQGSSNVNEYDPTTGAVDPSYMTDVGFEIVGAGVSTCAPTSPRLR
jgi:hypothetical protein